MKRILYILGLVLLASCAAPKKCCAQDSKFKTNLKKTFKFATFYGAVNGGNSVSDVLEDMNLFKQVDDLIDKGYLVTLKHSIDLEFLYKIKLELLK